jgi:hypothetical protein
MMNKLLCVMIVLSMAAASGCGQKARPPRPLPTKPKSFLFTHPSGAYSLELPRKPDERPNPMSQPPGMISYICKLGPWAEVSSIGNELDEPLDLTKVDDCKAELMARADDAIAAIQGEKISQEFWMQQQKYPLLRTKIKLPKLKTPEAEAWMTIIHGKARDHGLDLRTRLGHGYARGANLPPFDHRVR